MENETNSIVTVKTDQATKTTGGQVTFEIGREVGTDSLFLRLTGNDSSGTFSKEWVAFPVIREALDAQGEEPFRMGGVLQPLFVGKSKNNGSFLGHVLRALGFLSFVDPEKDTRVVVGGDWKAFLKEVLALPVKENEVISSETTSRSKSKKLRGTANRKAKSPEEASSDEIADDPES